MQELVEVVGRSSGVVLMAPPTESAEAAASVSTLLSTLKPKQKVRRTPPDRHILIANPFPCSASLAGLNTLSLDLRPMLMALEPLCC